MMHAEPAAVSDTQKLHIPQELASALGAHQHKTDYGIEAMKPSFLGRIIEKLLGPKKN